MAYIGRGLPHLRSNTEFAYTATAGQTVFAGLSYTPGALEVFVNGRKIRAFTATNGVSFTLTNACAAGDEVVAVSHANFHVVGAYTKDEADALFAVKSAIGNKQGYLNMTAAGTIAVADLGKLIRVFLAGAGTINVPNPASIPAGSTISIFNGQSVTSPDAVTLSTPSGQFLSLGDSPAAASTLVLRPAVQLDLVSDGANWRVLNGYGGAALAANGWQKLPSGLIIQWGSCSFNNPSAGLANVTFPIAFPNSVFSVSGLPDSTNNVSVIESMNYTLLTNSTVQFVCGMNTSLYTGHGRWMAIGN